MTRNLREYADRVRGIAIEAFPDNPPVFIESEMINKFLKGLLAKNAGLYCLNQRYTSLEQAIQAAQLYIENEKAMHGPRARQLEQWESSEDNSESVLRVMSGRREPLNRPLDSSNTKNLTQGSNQSQLDSIQSSVNKIESLLSRFCLNKPEASSSGDGKTSEDRLMDLEKRVNGILARQDHAKKTWDYADRGRGRSSSPTRCFSCQELGHMARECPRKSPRDRSRSPSPSRQVTFDLKGQERN